MQKQIIIGRKDYKSFEGRKRARFINSIVGFRSVHLVGTRDEEQQENLSIISSCFHMGSNPALLGFMIRPDVVPRHTLSNIRSTGKCTLNHVSKNFVEQAHQTSARYEKDSSEFKACGLTAEYLNDFGAPFVKESHLKMGLEFVREIYIEENRTHMIMTKIVDVVLQEDMMGDDGFVSIKPEDGILCSGQDAYHQTNPLGRLSYAKPNVKPKWL
jgi:flavin reductase (DIM6/NTAB) family NADH-FMN oxidoreductase RutF